MLEETTKQSKVVVKNKPTEPLPCVGSEVVVGYNPNEFYLMKSAELPVIEDLRQQKSSANATSSGTVIIDGTTQQPQFTFVCMNEDGELIEEGVDEPTIFLEEDEEQLLEQVSLPEEFLKSPRCLKLIFLLGCCPSDSSQSRAWRCSGKGDGGYFSQASQSQAQVCVPVGRRTGTGPSVYWRVKTTARQWS